MGWTLSIQGNYFIAEQTGAVLNVIHDYPAKDIAVRKKYVDSTDYSFFHSNGGSELIIKEMARVAFSDITAKNGEFTTLEEFEDWVRCFTGSITYFIDEIENKLDTISINNSLANSNNHFDIPQSNTSLLLVASNENRKELIIRNDSQGNQKLYIGFNDPATLNNAVILSKNQIWIEDKFKGEIYGIWDGNGNGFARIEEKIT